MIAVWYSSFVEGQTDQGERCCPMAQRPLLGQFVAEETSFVPVPRASRDLDEISREADGLPRVLAGQDGADPSQRRGVLGVANGRADAVIDELSGARAGDAASLTEQLHDGSIERSLLSQDGMRM